MGVVAAVVVVVVVVGIVRMAGRRWILVLGKGSWRWMPGSADGVRTTWGGLT